MSTLQLAIGLWLTLTIVAFACAAHADHQKGGDR